MMYDSRMLDANQIWNGLWQGAMPPPGSLVASHGFDALVLAAQEHQRPDFYPDVKVILAPGDDIDQAYALANFLPTWLRAASEVATRVKDGQKVLVTCMAGLNRSGFITTMALHHLTGWSGADCVAHVKVHRQLALCNKTFANYFIDNIKSREI